LTFAQPAKKQNYHITSFMILTIATYAIHGKTRLAMRRNAFIAEEGLRNQAIVKGNSR
jgi:hypothetical protein